MTDGVSNLKPYRWYVKVEARSPMYNTTHAAKTFSVEIEGDVEENKTTGISCVSGNNPKTNIVRDLNGRVVNEKSLTYGIYIKNGKKIVIK